MKTAKEYFEYEFHHRCRDYEDDNDACDASEGVGYVRPPQY